MLLGLLVSVQTRRVELPQVVDQADELPFGSCLFISAQVEGMDASRLLYLPEYRLDDGLAKLVYRLTRLCR